MSQYFSDGSIPFRAGDPANERRDYLEWCAKVRAIRYLPEYKLRKLWKLNFSPKDIEADRHHAVFPVKASRVRPGLNPEKRGKTMTRRGVDRRYAKILLSEATRIVKWHRLEPATLASVRADIENFSALVKKLHKGA